MDPLEGKTLLSSLPVLSSATFKQAEKDMHKRSITQIRRPATSFDVRKFAACLTELLFAKIRSS